MRSDAAWVCFCFVIFAIGVSADLTTRSSAPLTAVWPTSVTYAVDVSEWNGANASTPLPQVILFAHDTVEVMEAVRVALEFNLSVVVRSGRHQYTGLLNAELQNSTRTPRFAVIDVSNLTETAAFPNGVVAVGSGLRQYMVYQFAWTAGLLLPGGSCPTVGISGFVLGGGYGFFGRRHSIAADHLIGADLVAVDGFANPYHRSVWFNGSQEDQEILWALRGGGNNRFGVVTRLHLQLPELPASVNYCRVRISFDASACSQHVIARYEHEAPEAPQELYIQLVVFASSCDIVAVMEGDAAALNATLNITAWLAIPSAHVTTYVPQSTYPELVTDLAGCDNVTDCVERCTTVFPDPTHPTFFEASSVYVESPMGSGGMQMLLEALALKPLTLGFVFCEFDPYGDASHVNRLPRNATAFPHRASLYHIQCMVYADTPHGSVSAAHWIHHSVFDNILAAFGNGSYRNYPATWLPDASLRYFGGNLNRLEAVKERLDPLDVFAR